MADPRGRRPQVFRLDDDDLTLAAPEATADLPEAAERVEATGLMRPKGPRLFSLGAWFWTGLIGVLALAAGLAIAQLVQDLYARAEWLGYVGLAFAGVLGLAVLALITREVRGLVRLSSIDELRARAAHAVAADDRPAAETATRDLIALAAEKPGLAHARAELTSHLGAIIDGADLMRLTERTLMAPLDAQAQVLISEAAKRVSLVTAVSPRASVDLFFVLFTAVSLVRRLSELYGGRPGVAGMVRLVRHVLSHLAVTGGLSAGDDLIQQIIGQGLVGRLSARLGEGVVNGLLTARLGLAAVAVTRPMPFEALPPPRLSDVAANLIRRASEAEALPQPGKRRGGNAEDV